jgi:hypothetical protein
LRKNSDSAEPSLLYSIGALIESMDYRGRAAPAAPRESCLALERGPARPALSRRRTQHRSHRYTNVSSSCERVFPQHPSAVPKQKSTGAGFSRWNPLRIKKLRYVRVIESPSLPARLKAMP